MKFTKKQKKNSIYITIMIGIVLLIGGYIFPNFYINNPIFMELRNITIILALIGALILERI